MGKLQRQPIQWARIYRQTLTLIYKNFLVFWSSPISTLIRALLFPLIATAVLCSLKQVQSNRSEARVDTGFSDNTYRIPDLSVSMNQIGKTKLAIVLNGTSSSLVDPVVAGIKKLNGMDRMNVVRLEKTEELFDHCKQSIVGNSECYAAVIFSALDDENVAYTIAANEMIQSQQWGNWRTGGDGMDDFIYPLQWAVNSQIAGLDDKLRPSTRLFSGVFGPNQRPYEYSSVEGGPKFWLSVVTMFVGPFFVLALIGVVYHEATFIAAERESSMSELMSSQEVTIVPRILSTMLSFSALYLPGMVFSSVIMTQVLFEKTSDGIMIVLTILAGLSFVTFSHFLGSFFNKANLAGLYTSTLVFALVLITLYSAMKYYEPVEMLTAMGLLFPPFLWATLIEDIALRELDKKGFGVSKIPRKIDSFGHELSKAQFLTGSLYFIFFVVQIFGYAFAAYLVERYLWSVKRVYNTIDASSDVAVRCTSLSKTYHAKRRWYWPFSRQGDPVVAVENLDLEVKKGSVTFLLGPNGGGKTTTLKCIAGMIPMNAGSHLELNEHGVVFGICPQHNVFWPGLTVKQHIDIWTKLKTAAQPVDVQDDVLAECDLLDKLNAPANTLSGGQMRKLQLAISFCGGSKVCCIDEASSGLDPLSRRSIWNIIQKGHSKRTILVTTHFLDEADVLADHIAVMYKGKLVCEGATTALKARYGDSYIIRNNAISDGEDEDDSMVWRTSNSAEATRKLLELEDLDNDNTYNVQFPTLEQVFLKVTSDTAIHGNGGDGFVGALDTTAVIDEKIFALENEYTTDIDLDVGHGTGFFRQIVALFDKRYMLLRQRTGWISYAINLAIPIIIAAVIAKFLRDFVDMNTCQMAVEEFRNPVEKFFTAEANPGYPVLSPWQVYTGFWYQNGSTIAFMGPESTWSDERYTQLYVNEYADQITVSDPGLYESTGTSVVTDPDILQRSVLASRSFVSKLDNMTHAITNAPANFYGFGIWAPPNEAAIIFHSAAQDFTMRGSSIKIMDLVTSGLVNGNSTGNPKRFATTVISFRQPVIITNFFALPISAVISLAFIAAASIAIMYPAYEMINHVRALQYCNGVRPAALWIGYLLFDMQFIVIESIVVWAVMFAGNVTRLYYESSYLIGVFILFGIATYLGTYFLSLFVKKAAFAIAAGIHIVLVVLYFISYVLIEQAGDKNTRHAAFSAVQMGFGLSSPAANLLRGMWLAWNSFGILCGQYADNDVSNPFAYVRYGGVYTNLIIQILFLALVLGLYEYGSADFIRRITNRAVPSRLHYIVETAPTNDNEKTHPAITQANTAREILKVSSISKYFGKEFAVENVSFTINANETLALLGGNGAGKTTTINVIRGDIVPNFGDIFLNGTSVLHHPARARLQMGVCPQDDAVDNLSVSQTLRFYATVKGLKNVEGNVTRVLTALNITSYSDLLVKELSGGTKRKLSVAIALLGNPRLLLLDEPSTGQDAGAKRILWKALKNVSANRAILLTTHSMEEASALATNVAIMGTKMLATGTLSSLQQRYGGAFVIRAVRAQGTDAATVEQQVKKLFDNTVKDYNDSHGQVTFTLPHVESHLGSIMKTMEELKGEKIYDEVDEEQSDVGLGGSSRAAGSSAAQAEKKVVICFTDYTINGPTLEEVFMNVARESGVAGEV